MEGCETKRGVGCGMPVLDGVRVMAGTETGGGGSSSLEELRSSRLFLSVRQMK